MRVVHVIVGLGVGGAESMLLKLLRTMDRSQFEPTVVTLMDGGALRGPILELGIPVHSLGLKRGVLTPAALWKLWRLAASLKPDLIQGWMYHGNLAAWQMARWAQTEPALLWNIRHSIYDLAHESLSTRILLRLSAPLSQRPRNIVFNSTVSIAQHRALGFATEHAAMLPNGFDLDVYRPDPAAGLRLRNELGLGEEAVLIGVVGRRHPVKGHEDLLRAAALVLAKHPQAHFLLAGLGLEGNDAALLSLAGALPEPDHVHWLGQRSDMPEFMPGLDLLVLPSLSEGFPNVLGEAMACGVPCVTTRVGAAEEIVGDCGRVVRPGQPSELAGALGELLMLDGPARLALGARARQRIADHYSLDAIAEKFAELYNAGI